MPDLYGASKQFACLTPDIAAFYANHSSFSTPGTFAMLYADLPPEPARLARITRDLMIHRWEGGNYHYGILPERLHNDAETRYIDNILAIIVERNDAPLPQGRGLDDRFVGTCRDFALLFCSFLRHQGIPARVRSGFADYFGRDGFHHDHMISEYWDEQRGWCLADPQVTDPVIASPLDLGFDPVDIPRDRFLDAGTAWRMIRKGDADPKTFGLKLPDRIMSGENFVAGNLLLDIAALNKAEPLVWDIWGAIADIDSGITDADRELYDQIAEVTAGTGDFEQAREMYLQDARLRMPQTVLSLAPYNGPRHVTLRDSGSVNM
ncbi:transglutaminase domain-containing protein [Nonomuraea phyllanthi]|uniref:Transglutaminase domain-containing protein n=1 Tax=Nonomuraea phyllanthi TaxID=2219224 RepID=A0A5C4UR18_9ACTN|nr:transglutaminase domain-containing protein [Nonomuraea phyllanthi]KAB8181307.1 transglutaminase domain-containing protein [Nonomuraea phyllanthi]